MKKFMKVFTAVMLILAIMVPVFGSAENLETANAAKVYYVKTNGSKLNMRSDTEVVSSNVIMGIPNGTKVNVYQFVENGKWALIEYNCRVGYCSANYLTQTDPSGRKTTSRSFEVALGMNPSAGYSWKIENSNKSICNVVDNGYYANYSGLGGSGAETFRLDGLRQGFSTVTFRYVAPGQSASNSTCSVTYVFEVDSQLNVNVYDTYCQYC